MKLFIAADMEGLAGVVAKEEVDPSHREYPLFTEIMTAEVNAAAEGARAGGFEHMVVNDVHNYGRNILPDKLDADIILSRGQPIPLITAPLDESFDAMALIGFHGRRGTAHAILDHTLTQAIHWVRVNGREYGELGLAALFAGSMGVPLVFASGDDKLAHEAHDLVAGVETAVVKHTSGRTNACCLSPSRARAAIMQGMRRAAAKVGHIKPLRLDAPYLLEAELFESTAVEVASALPGVEPRAGRSIQARFDNMRDLSLFLSVLTRLIRF